MVLQLRFAANCICKIPWISNRWDLLNSSRDWNPGLLVEKRERYLCAKQPPFILSSYQDQKLFKFLPDEDDDEMSRPRSHAPWLYPSDIQIEPSSLEVSPKLSHQSLSFTAANDSPGEQSRGSGVGR